MPCRYDEYGPGVPAGPSKTEKQLREDLNKVTKAACDLISGLGDIICDEVVSASGVYDTTTAIEWARKNDYVSAETVSWIKAHQEADKIRTDALRASAIAKLTDDEREVLGI